MILVLTDLYVPFPGGAERLIFNLARALHQRGLDVSVLTGYHAALPFDGPPVRTASIGVMADRDAGAEYVAGQIAELRPDAILTHHLYASQFEAELDASGVPYAQVVLNGRRLPGAAFAVYISQWVRDRVPGRPDDLLLTPPAFAHDVAAGEHEHAVGFVKPIEHKGVRLVYQLAEAMPDRQFVVLRGEWQGIELIRGDLPNVRYVEPVVDMRDFYRQVDVLLVPSLSEDAGTVAQEATLNGLPCVSSNAGGLAETNAGGIQLDPQAPAGEWVAALRALEDPGFAAAVVALQGDALAATDRDGRLDELAARFRRLTG